MADKEADVFDEDYDEEDDEEAGDDDDDDPSAKRQKKSEFIEEEAEVDEEADEDDDEEGDVHKDFIENDDSEEKMTPAQRAQLEQQRRQLMEQEPRKSRRDIVSSIQNKYLGDGSDKAQDDRIIGDDDEEEEEEYAGTGAYRQHAARAAPHVRELRQQRHMPTATDPRLFLVKVKQGKEREVVITLLQKYLGNPNTMEITSAYAVDSLKGSIYVEAFKETHVKTAIQNVQHIRGSLGVKLVPIKEMTSALPMAKKAPEIAINQWVRIKRGLYKGDLAQIVDVDDAKQAAFVKMIPRIDPKEGTDGDNDDSTNSKKRKANHLNRLPQRFFSRDDFSGVEKDSKQYTKYGDMKFEIWRGKRFYKGFIFKHVPFKTLETKNINPSVDEIEKFHQGDDHTKSSLASLKQKVVYNKGDTIRVVEGDLKSMVGTVLSVQNDTDTVVFLPKHKAINHPLTVPTSEIQKFFELGTLCKVISGNYAGEIGLVTENEGDKVALYNDTKKQEIKVFASEVAVASEVSSNEVSVGNYSLHDLIKINDQTCGVIVKVDKDVFKVLDNNGVVKTISLQEMGQKRKQKSDMKIPDKNGTPVGVDDTIRVGEGLHKGRQGVVKHIFRYFFFCYSKDMNYENSGMFVVRSKQCELRSMVRGSMMSSATLAQDNRPNATGGMMRPPVTRNDASKRSRNTLALLNKTVRIKKGIFKGYIGIVKDGNDQSVRVELHSQSKTVSIPTDDVVKVEDDNNNSGNNRRPMGAPMGGSSGFTSSSPMPPRNVMPQTPRDNYYLDKPKTPGGAETPARTPFGGGIDYPETPRTPSHESVWNPKNPNTPLRESREYGSSSQSSQHHHSHLSSQGSSYHHHSASQQHHQIQTPIYASPFTPSIPPVIPPPSGMMRPNPAMGLHQQSHLSSSQVPITPFAQSNYGSYETPHYSSQPYTPMPVTTPHIPPQTPMTGPQTPMLPTGPQTPISPAYPPMPTTPGVPITPFTPSAVYASGSHGSGVETPGMPGALPPTTPMVSTPFAPMDHEAHWAEPDLEVLIENGSYAGRRGVVKRIIESSCFVALDGGKEVDVHVSALGVTTVSLGDSVKVIKGPNAGLYGTVMSVSQNMVVVKFSASSGKDVSVLDEHLVAKFRSRK